ncbi:hypothetical protein AOQ84DRAFT_280564 [Glonium stellatum]|uniref:Tat pathway signal sequence protein n=1 Tax=Glonium stellatum TaxID=574774 RepID=A0A8E2FCY3_9PEZI|nr:hypothetical protein AOQ84DRAFT_280564 [Glonium stellatum]
MFQTPLTFINNLTNQAPAKGSISYVISSEHSTDHLKYSAYSGPPSEENNRAWETLIEPTFFGATEQELIEAGESVNDSVKLAAGGYVAALGVYHEIHCLRQLRLFLYSDVYYPNLTQANIKYLQGHLGHCIETLRISVMCQADMSLYTFRWENSTDDRPATKSNAKRQCVNWDPLEKWSQNRKVSLWPVLLRTTGEAEKIHLKD